MNPDLIRRIVIGVVAVVILSSVGWLVATFVYNGTITITGGDSSLDVVITTSDGVAVARHSKANQFRLAPGQYRVVATTGKSGISRLVQVSPLANTEVKVGDTALLHANIALRSPLYGVTPRGKWFIGYEPTTQLMKRYDATGANSMALGSPAEIGQEGNWDTEVPEKLAAYQTYGDRQALAISYGKIYSIATGAVSEVNQEGLTLNNKTLFSYVIGANNVQTSFVIGYGRDVYLYTDANAKAQKAYSNKAQFDQMAYGGDYAILYSTALPNSREDLRASFTDHQIDPQVVNVKNGKTYLLHGPITSATISPDGKYATVKPRGEHAYLYDLVNMKQVTTIDQPDGAAPFWISPTTYIYEKNQQVWRYNTQSQTSDQLANVTSTITSFSNDGKGGYLATYYNSDLDCGVLDITQTALPPAVTPVQQFLPYTGDNFSIEYSNVNGPTITITTQAILNYEWQRPKYRADTKTYRQQALDYLKSNGVNPADFTIIYDPADPL